ncbi:coenzyme Q-binding protein COQ10 homolog A, mitochondrial [Leptinotarsa decemlineata]|uniref:coenzyme Q-binding protein COQ10 homolog A, mitochondrial n=1 Tax=Leptinotarsa decemlineata TaxID=7539 RepID=UPI000C254405|nr:coenzyme Q-binding protein COQ10 homolog A, mitochondrial [Leptinotarsa decemlineata]
MQVPNIKHILPYPKLGYRFLFKIQDKKKEYVARKLVGFSNNEMYQVVSDVKRYKQFLPFCTKSTILMSKPNQLHANLEIGFPPIVENYTSKVFLDEPNSVKAICTDGRLFNYLETTWKFSSGLQSNPRTCIIDFYIQFEFKSAIYSHVASMFFERLVQQMEKAFIDEVRKRYGNDSIPIHELSPVRN